MTRNRKLRAISCAGVHPAGANLVTTVSRDR